MMRLLAENAIGVVVVTVVCGMAITFLVNKWMYGTYVGRILTHNFVTNPRGWAMEILKTETNYRLMQFNLVILTVVGILLLGGFEILLSKRPLEHVRIATTALLLVMTGIVWPLLLLRALRAFVVEAQQKEPEPNRLRSPYIATRSGPDASAGHDTAG